MKQTPILFSTDMVKAILEGRKTQTRRVVKPQPDENGADFMKNPPILDWEQIYKEVWKPWIWDTNEGERIQKFCPYGQPGDVLWVRESFAINGTRVLRGCEGEIIEETPQYVFKGQKQPQIERLFKWKPSIHMPREAARIWLEVTGIRIERLNDISENDAKAEGVEKSNERNAIYFNYVNKLWELPTAQQSFFSLWHSINGIKSWKANSWVWVIEFEKFKIPTATVDQNHV